MNRFYFSQLSEIEEMGSQNGLAVSHVFEESPSDQHAEHDRKATFEEHFVHVPSVVEVHMREVPVGSRSSAQNLSADLALGSTSRSLELSRKVVDEAHCAKLVQEGNEDNSSN